MLPLNETVLSLNPELEMAMFPVTGPADDPAAVRT
jgi:hypothetical protein